MKQFGLRTQLTLIFSLVFAAILILVTGVSYRILKFRLNENLRQELTERAAGLRGYIHFKEGKPVFQYDPSDPDEAFFVESSTRYYQIFDHATGELVDQSHELDLLDVDMDPDKIRGIGGRTAFSEAETGDVRLLFHNEMIRAPGGHVYLIQIGLRRDFVDGALANPTARPIVPNLQRLLAHARDAGWAVVFSNDAHHPDDPEISAGGTLARWAKAGSIKISGAP